MSSLDFIIGLGGAVLSSASFYVGWKVNTLKTWATNKFKRKA